MEIKIRNARVADMLTVYEQICDLEEKALNINYFQKNLMLISSIKILFT